MLKLEKTKRLVESNTRLFNQLLGTQWNEKKNLKIIFPVVSLLCPCVNWYVLLYANYMSKKYVNIKASELKGVCVECVWSPLLLRSPIKSEGFELNPYFVHQPHILFHCEIHHITEATDTLTSVLIWLYNPTEI